MFFKLVVPEMSYGKLELKICQKKERDVLFLNGLKERVR